MSRMGHASPRAALIYQHATPERDRLLAEALSQLAGTGAGTTRTEDASPHLCGDRPPTHRCRPPSHFETHDNPEEDA
jgi:hypothetical protein